MKVIGTVLIAFGTSEHRQYVLPPPAAVPKPGPVVVVGLLAAHVNHGVDGRTSTQNFTSRVTDAAAIQACLGFGLKAPIGPWVANGIEVADRNVDPEVVVLFSGFKQ